MRLRIAPHTPRHRLAPGVLLLASLLLAPPAPGAPGDAPPSGGSTEPPTLRDQSGRVGDLTPQREAGTSVSLDGRVTDGAGKAMFNVPVKLFADGVTVTATTTAADGTFRINANPMRSAKGSGVLWIQSPDAEKYVDANVILWSSAEAKAARLFSPCTMSLEGKLAASLDITLRSVDEEKKAVVAAKCLGGS